MVKSWTISNGFFNSFNSSLSTFSSLYLSILPFGTTINCTLRMLLSPTSGLRSTCLRVSSL